MSARHLPDKVAIVTGSARGIGRAIAVRFADEGARVVVNYVEREEAALDVVSAIQANGGDAIAVRRRRFEGRRTWTASWRRPSTDSAASTSWSTTPGS